VPWDLSSPIPQAPSLREPCITTGHAPPRAPSPGWRARPCFRPHECAASTPATDHNTTSTAGRYSAAPRQVHESRPNTPTPLLRPASLTSEDMVAALTGVLVESLSRTSPSASGSAPIERRNSAGSERALSKLLSAPTAPLSSPLRARGTSILDRAVPCSLLQTLARQKGQAPVCRAYLGASPPPQACRAFRQGLEAMAWHLARPGRLAEFLSP
jgi:hypothetical protein